jgi:trehalose 6-phosphate phosphatase
MRSRDPRLSKGLNFALGQAAEADQLLIAFDFDGTLSPIVANYESATADRDALELLFALAALPRTRVAVISGRARADLERRLGSCPPDVLLVGSHGAEHGVMSETDSGSETAEHSGRIERFAELLVPIVQNFPGARLEKKPFSLAFHFRNIGESRQEEARSAAIEMLGQEAVAVKDGKKVVEFFAVNADKGSALARIQEHTAAMAEGRPLTTLFVGDDVTDEAAFEVLTGEDIGVKVGPGPTAARFAVEDQEEVAPMLRRLLQLRSEATGA